MLKRLFLLSLTVALTSCTVNAQGPSDFVRTVIDLPDGRSANAIAYGSDGRLLVVSSGQNSILAIGPQGLDGSESLISLSGAAAPSQVSSAIFDPTRGRLLVTDLGFSATPGGPAAGSILSVDTATGETVELFSAAEIQGVSDIAVRSTGEIFVSVADFNGTGGIFLIDDSAPAGPTAVEVVTGLDAAAGLVFDAGGDLVFLNGNDGRGVAFGGDGSGDFSAEVSRLEITETAGGLEFNSSPTQLASGSTGEIDLVIDSEGDFFASGTLGLFELDSDASGNLTGGETRLLVDLNPDFSSALAFLPGSAPFDSSQTIAPGADSPILSVVSNSSDEQIIFLSLNVVSVPEPSAVPLSMLLCLPLVLRRNR